MKSEQEIRKEAESILSLLDSNLNTYVFANKFPEENKNALKYLREDIKNLEGKFEYLLWILEDRELGEREADLFEKYGLLSFGEEE